MESWCCGVGRSAQSLQVVSQLGLVSFLSKIRMLQEALSHQHHFATLSAHMASSVVVIVHMLVNLGEIGKKVVTSVTYI